MTNPNEEGVETHVRFWSRVYNRLRDVNEQIS